jgi:Lipocalin-like domain
MTRVAAIVFAVLLILPASAHSADNPLVGTWKLKSYLREVAATGERYNERGEHPNGYFAYSADGRMYAIITWENRIAPRDVVPTNDERVKLFSTMISYAGTYTFDAEKVVHNVDISWNQNWTGTEQVRFYKLDGDTLTITSALPKISPTDARAAASWCGSACGPRCYPAERS